MNPLLYWRTVRHLKWTQVTSRLRRRYQRLDLNGPIGMTERDRHGRIGNEPWRTCALQDDATFCFLNERRRIDQAANWNAPGAPKLWLYNLHYFDWINARTGSGDAAEACAEATEPTSAAPTSAAPTSAAPTGAEPTHAAAFEWIRRWMAENPPPFGNGWEPYPISLRIVNWIKWLARRPTIDASERSAITASLALQAHVLSQRIETHLLGNHLLANGKALVFAGCWFSGAIAERWLAQGLAILDQELDEQLLSDGGYFELSPMYHAIVLEDLLDALSLQHAYPDIGWAQHGLSRERLAGCIAAMLGWLERMTHPDGAIALFNDAAFGIAPQATALRRYADALDVAITPPHHQAGIEWLRASGFVRVDRSDCTAILDVGRIGPEYLPGHAHADTLTFEWSIGRERVLVDSGTSLYAEGAERLRQRGTAAHNTVIVDDCDSSEVWGQFRVARRAYPIDVQIDWPETAHDETAAWLIEAAHDGYRRLPGQVVHRRRWRFGPRTLTVTDRLHGRFGHAEARFHLHPEARPERQGDAVIEAVLRSGRCVRIRVACGRLRLEQSSFHPEFGRSIPNWCVVVALAGGVSEVTFEA